MSAEFSGNPALTDLLAQLERAFIAEFLQRRGHTLSSISELPEESASALLREASLYASGRLTEVESRAHFVSDIHDGARPLSGRGPGRTR